MAFSFGKGTGGGGSTGGFAFGTPSTTANTGTTGFSFGTTTNTPAPAPTGFGFGTPAASKPATGLLTTNAAAPAAGGFSLGTATAPTAQTSTPAASTGGFSFGGPSLYSLTGTTAATVASAAPAPSGFSFTTPAAPAASTYSLAGSLTAGTPATTAPTAGFALGGTPASTAATAAGFTLGGAKPASTGFTLGGGAPVGFSLAPKTTAPAAATTVLAGLLSTSNPASSTATSTAAATALKLGAPTQVAATPSLVPAATSATLGGLSAAVKPGFSLATSAAVTSSAVVSTTTVAAAATAGPTMTYRQLEESINKWTLELEEQESEFLRLATQVNAWDRLLIDNGEKITSLNNDVDKVKLDQQRLDHELDFIQAQQKELEEMLLPLEQAVDQLPTIGYHQHADLERERTYQLSETVDGQLKRMVSDLKEVIDHLNTTSSNTDTNDPLHQISRILNAHMDSLNWVDQNTALVHRRVEEIAKMTELRRRDQERNFKLAYD